LYKLLIEPYMTKNEYKYKIETYIDKYEISFTSAKYKLCLEQISKFEFFIADILKQYIKNHKLKENNYLFGLTTDSRKRQSESNFSKLVTSTFNKVYKSSVSITNKWVRVSYATYLNTLNLTIKQRKDIALKMAHNFTTNLQYGKTMINIDDID